ncbi:MAG: ROK family glucokinase [Lachnospiraceae bacterium]|jgi:glucokinase|nr:ROK family glucokinase [Lachnospiraceae bacterium]MEE3461351.1 ROK family glucokinase [Lachnospiraceae bacterium]
MGKYLFGVDIGGTTVKLGLFDADGDLREKWEISTRKEDAGKNILPDIAHSVLDKLIEFGIRKSDCIGIGIGVPGPVKRDGTVLKCANLGWDVFNVSTVMRELTGIPNIQVANDANVAALGELWKGGGKGYENIVMVTLGTGVGGGVIVDGKILSGNQGAAGEIGHINVNPDETEVCGCGKRGCLEQYASATGIVRLTNKILKEDARPSKLRNLDKITAKDIFDFAKTGDVLSLEAVDLFARYLAYALAQVAQVVDPGAFVIGGGVSKAGNIIIDSVKKYFDQNVMFALKGKAFNLAKLGNDAGIFGCAYMIIG